MRNSGKVWDSVIALELQSANSAWGKSSLIEVRSGLCRWMWIVPSGVMNVDTWCPGGATDLEGCGTFRKGNMADGGGHIRVRSASCLCFLFFFPTGEVPSSLGWPTTLPHTPKWWGIPSGLWAKTHIFSFISSCWEFCYRDNKSSQKKGEADKDRASGTELYELMASKKQVISCFRKSMRTKVSFQFLWKWCQIMWGRSWWGGWESQSHDLLLQISNLWNVWLSEKWHGCRNWQWMKELTWKWAEEKRYLQKAELFSSKNSWRVSLSAEGKLCMCGMGMS